MDSELIKNILDSIYETGAIIIEPADDDIIKRVQEDLKAEGIIAMPEDLIVFLKEIANGVSWNGFEFFGTYQATEKNTGYVLENIIRMNSKYRERKIGMAELLLVGRFDDDIYVYEPATGLYKTLDSLTLTEIDSYESFDDLFVSSMLPYIDDTDYLPEDDGNADT